MDPPGPKKAGGTVAQGPGFGTPGPDPGTEVPGCQNGFLPARMISRSSGMVVLQSGSQ